MKLIRIVFCALAVAVMSVMGGISTTNAGTDSDVVANIGGQLERTVAKLRTIPVNSYPADTRMGNVMLATAGLFLDTPYVPGTLETKEERLVVRLDAFDCATLVDTVLALSRSLLISGEKDRIPTMFIEELRAVRYRNGQVTSYLDRLHYTMDWIAENERTGRVRDITAALGGINRTLRLSLASLAMGKDERFIGRPDLIAAMQRQEAVISKKPQCYIPTEKVESIVQQLRPGDIICFVSRKPELDTVHVAVFAGMMPGCDVPTFIHASSKAGRVLVEPKGLVAYLKQRKTAQGIVVVRPVNCAG